MGVSAKVRLSLTLLIMVALLLSGFVLLPRIPGDISPFELVSASLVKPKPPDFPTDRVGKQLLGGYEPILEGSDLIDGRDTWAVRLKVPPPAKYPWIEVWIDKRTSTILAWKEWGKRNGRVKVLSQFPPD